MKSSDTVYAALLFVLLASFYLLTTVGYVSTSMGVTAYETAKSLIEDGDLALDHPTLETGVGTDGKYYTYEGLGFILVVALFYGLTRFFGIHPNQWGIITNQLLMPVACALLYLIGRELKFSKRASVLLALVYGVGTMAWVHARYLMPEPLTVVVYLAAFLFLLKYKNRRRAKWLLWSGCLAGLSLMVRADAPLFVFGISLGMLILLAGEFRSNSEKIPGLIRKGLIFCLPIIVFVGIYMYYNYVRFGNILELGYSTKAEVVTESTGEKSAHYSEGVRGTLLGFAGMWLIPCRSMFFINPVLIFIFWGLKDFWKKYRFESIVICILLAFHILLYVNRGSEGFPGSSAWGVRYMVPMTAFMVIIMGVWIDKLFAPGKRRTMRKVFGVVFTVSILIQFVGAGMNYQVTQGQLEKELNSQNHMWAARRAMNLDPRWNLITRNLERMKLGQADFMYYNYLTRGDFISHPRERRNDAPGWVWPSLLFLLVTFGTSGYLLYRRFMTAEAVPVEKKDVKQKRRKRAGKSTSS